MSSWIDALFSSGARGEDAVLVSVAATKGSSPREAGARMVVTARTAFDSIGGGELELRATAVAREMLGRDAGRTLQRFPLGAELGQVCGGRVELVFERVPAGASWPARLAEHLRGDEDLILATVTVPGQAQTAKIFLTALGVEGSTGSPQADAALAAAARDCIASGEETPRELVLDGGLSAVLEPFRSGDFRIVLFGAGHVGRALAEVLGRLPCRVTWVDPRPGQFPERIPANVTVCADADALGAVEAAPAGAWFVVMTHSHELDRALGLAILRRADFRYFGMLGSVTKRRQFERQFLEHGISPGLLEHMCCPIGIEGIHAKQPAVIAVAVAAELLVRREAAGAVRGPGGILA